VFFGLARRQVDLQDSGEDEPARATGLGEGAAESPRHRLRANQQASRASVAFSSVWSHADQRYFTVGRVPPGVI
jgi:hypothetical protein